MRKSEPGRIRIGVGGWNYDAWGETFYPKGLPRARQLEHASRALTSIEIDSTYYGGKKPEIFRGWRDAAPDGFVFSVKGSRYVTNRRVLAEAGPSVERFFETGPTELGAKLGPINWQFARTKTFDPVDFAAFLALLPRSHDGVAIRHAVEVRNDSFRTPEFVDLARAHGVAVVIAGDSDFPLIADPTAPFVYARIMGTTEDAPRGYSDQALDAWATRARTWAGGETPDDLATLRPPAEAPGREVFLYVISGFKARNPLAATALIERLA
ncbi:uncharacterized protein YecE (DUF72 family) [Roseiarcus fermentans]|uniref:Uncharacterized protein YecE (DUF72 family) n=1 Tax=Roseiarcus fermentans TaxID=1473586 RepID=A0A366FDX6_9HYPH|nr:DUF72 domain-containing protein [Roseiarcus fermentans]RBP12286.1 uncharacterized protein YecE (DUF72 family) [Roseiarcus fermentans]